MEEENLMGFTSPIELPKLGPDERAFWQSVYNTALQYFLKEEQSSDGWFRRRDSSNVGRCLKLSTKMADRAVIDYRQRTKGADSNAK